jgi:hypothetical protein
MQTNRRSNSGAWLGLPSTTVTQLNLLPVPGSGDLNVPPALAPETVYVGYDLQLWLLTRGQTSDERKVAYQAMNSMPVWKSTCKVALV